MKLGVIGTGAITRSMLAEYRRCEQFEIYAICSRREETRSEEHTSELQSH